MNFIINLVIAAATQRSGSTLLQRICNARSRTLIWGEHGGALNNFVNMYSNLLYFSSSSEQERTAFFQQPRNPNAWIANMTPEPQYVDSAVVAATKALFDNLYKQSGTDYDMVGFKEVRYGAKALHLLKTCYPDLKVLLLVRHPVECWKSTPKDWGNKLSDFIDAWNGFAIDFYNLMKSEDSYQLFRYEDIVARDGETLERLSRLIDVPVERILDILAVKIGGNTNKEISIEDKAAIIQQCGEGMELHQYPSTDPGL